MYIANGSLFTGNIVTVAPSGGDYTSLKNAIDAATDDTLFLVSPGSYGNYQDIFLNKNIKYYIKRNGGSSPSDCVINFANTGNFVHQAGQVILEGVKLSNTQSESFCFATYDGQAIINKCDIYARFPTGSGENGTHNSTFTIQYSKLHTYWGGYYAHVGYVNFSKTTLLKVAWSAEAGGWSTYQIYGGTGDFISEDVAASGTSGYGYDYGDYLIEDLDAYLYPTSTKIAPTETRQFQVLGLYQGTSYDLTSYYTFVSSDTAVATINASSGLATAVASGTTTITATNTLTSATITATLTVVEDTGYTIRTPLTFIGLSENTLADSTHVGWINSRFVANETGTNRFYFTDTNPYTSLLENNYWLSTDNPITCDSRGDKLSALFTAWQEIYAWGNQGLQVFQDDGVTPFVNVPGATSEVALEAIYSIKKIDNTIFALCVVDSKRAVIKFQGRSPQIISEPIASILAGMDTVSDAIGDIICVGGIAIYMLNFPTANQTWAYDYKNDVWLRWGYFNTTTGNHDRFIGQHCCFVKKWNKYLIMSRLDGKIYELSRTAYDDAGNGMVSYRRTGWLDWNDISKIKRSKELAIKVKTFADDGTTDPVLMMRWRDEGYPIWSDAVEIPMNPKYFGDFIYTVTRMGSYRARQYEFRLSDGVDMALVSVQENLG